MIDANVWNRCCYNQSAPRNPAWYPVACNVSKPNLSFLNCAPLYSKSSCVTNYYGNECNVYCSSSSQRYTCEDNGSRKCKSSLHGTQCLPKSYHGGLDALRALFIVCFIAVVVYVVHWLYQKHVRKRKTAALKGMPPPGVGDENDRIKLTKDWLLNDGYRHLSRRPSEHKNTNNSPVQPSLSRSYGSIPCLPNQPVRADPTADALELKGLPPPNEENDGIKSTTHVLVQNKSCRSSSKANFTVHQTGSGPVIPPEDLGLPNRHQYLVPSPKTNSPAQQSPSGSNSSFHTSASQSHQSVRPDQTADALKLTWPAQQSPHGSNLSFHTSASHQSVRSDQTADALKLTWPAQQSPHGSNLSFHTSASHQSVRPDPTADALKLTWPAQQSPHGSNSSFHTSASHQSVRPDQTADALKLTWPAQQSPHGSNLSFHTSASHQSVRPDPTADALQLTGLPPPNEENDGTKSTEHVVLQKKSRRSYLVPSPKANTVQLSNSGSLIAPEDLGVQNRHQYLVPSPKTNSLAQQSPPGSTLSLHTRASNQSVRADSTAKVSDSWPTLSTKSSHSEAAVKKATHQFVHSKPRNLLKIGTLPPDRKQTL